MQLHLTPLRARWACWLAAALCALGTVVAPASARPPPERPNILFFVLDDVGIDQMKVFGYGGATPPRTPWKARTAMTS